MVVDMATSHAMNKRPRSVTVISGIFIAFGGIALLTGLLPPVDAAAAQHIAELKAQHPFEYVLVYIARILAVLCSQPIMLTVQPV